jgi:hypothetical protein
MRPTLEHHLADCRSAKTFNNTDFSHREYAQGYRCGHLEARCGTENQDIDTVSFFWNQGYKDGIARKELPIPLYIQLALSP